MPGPVPSDSVSGARVGGVAVSAASSGSSAAAAGGSSALPSSATSAVEVDEAGYVLSLYSNIGLQPRTTWVRKLGQIAAALDDRAALLDDTHTTLMLHLTQLEELLHNYLKPSEYKLATAAGKGEGSTAGSNGNGSASSASSSTGAVSSDPPAVPSLLFHSPEFTAYFLDTALPGLVRHLLFRNYSAGLSATNLIRTRGAAAAPASDSDNIIPRIHAFFQLVLRVIVKHLKEPAKPVTIQLPPPPATATAATAAGAQPAAAVPAATPASPPALVTVTVAPLFPDSVCTNLLTCLGRIFDRDRSFYYFHDGAGTSRTAITPATSAADDLEDTLDESVHGAKHAADMQQVREADPQLLLQKHGMSVEQMLQRVEAAFKGKMKAREKRKAAKLAAADAKAKADAEKALEPPPKPAVQYSITAPGSLTHGLFQANLQFFGEIGGYDLIVERLAVGVNANIDSRIPIPSRRGYNPAQGANHAFYTKEHQARMQWRAQQEEEARAQGKELPPDTDPAVKGSFPSIAPFLTSKSFVPSHPTTLTRVPLHRIRLFLDPMLKLVALKQFHLPWMLPFVAQLKDLMTIRLLHIGPDESRFCDKEYLLNILQEYLWKFIYQLRCQWTQSWDVVKWPVMDDASTIAYAEYKARVKADAEAAQAEAKENGVEGGASAAALMRLSAPPPLLWEQNWNADEVMECITIYLSYQLFSSPLLEKRINGLADINRMIELTVTRDRLERNNQSATSASGRIAVTAWLSMQSLSDYLVEIQIVDDIMGEYDPDGSKAKAKALNVGAQLESNVIGAANKDKNTHPQLIQRCDEILKYFARMGKLKPDMVRQVWMASIGKHESIQLAVYALLASIVRMLKHEHVQLLLQECLAVVPYVEWDNNKLALLANLARGADLPPSPTAVVDESKVQLQEQTVRTAVAILWSILTLPHETAEASSSSAAADALSACPARNPSDARVNVSFFVKQQCAFQIQSLLSKPWLEPLRREYIMLVIAAIRAHAAAPPASQPHSIGMLYWLLPSLFAAYQADHTLPEPVQRWRFINTLNEKQHLVALIFTDLAAHVATARLSLPAVQAAVRKRLGGRQRGPDSSLLVLTGAVDPAGDAGCLGIAVSDLDAAVTLPASLEASEVLDALKLAIKNEAAAASNPTATATTGAGAVSSVSNATMGRSNTSTAACAVQYSEHLSHELEVLLRLELVRFMMQHAYVHLNDKNLEQVWNAVAPPFALSPRAATLWHTWVRILHQPKPAQQPTWITAAAYAQAAAKTAYGFFDSSRHATAFHETVAQQMFLNRLCAPPRLTPEDASGDWAHMDESLFLCWRHYFMLVNEAARLIQLHAPLIGASYNAYCMHSGESTPRTPVPRGAAPPVKFGLVCSQVPLQGLEQLWSICLNAQNPSVVSMACDLLIQVHACIDAPLLPAVVAEDGAGSLPASTPAEVEQCAEWQYQMRERFIGRCMEAMKQSEQAGTTANPANSARILRCLNLLHSFMQVCASPESEDKDESGDGSNGSVGANGQFTLLVRLGPFSSNPDEVTRLDVNESMTVKAVKEQLSALVSAPPSKIGMVLTQAPQRELLNYEPLSSRLVPTAGVPTVSLCFQTNRSNINHAGNEARMPGEEDAAEEDDEADAATLSLARNFTPAATSASASRAAGNSLLGHDTPLPQTPAVGSDVYPAASAPSQAATNVTASSRQPTQLLANRQENFDLLFSLLSSGAEGPDAQEISQRVWKLITSLPTNQRLLDEMKQLSDVEAQAHAAHSGDASASSPSPWSKLLDPQSPFKLLYSLRIVSKLAQTHLLAASGASTASAATTKAYFSAVEWRNKFLRLGGVEYLYALLRQLMAQRTAAMATMAAPAAGGAQWDESRNACLALLLKLFSFFLLCAQAHTNRAILYLLPEVLQELAPASTLAQPDPFEPQLIALMRGLSNNVDFLRAVHFPSLTQACLRLMADCAKSASKAYRSKDSGQAGHARSNSSTGLQRGTSLLGGTPARAAGAPIPPTPVSSSADASSELASLDGFLLKHAMVLLSACVLHVPGPAEQQPDGGLDPASPSCLSVLMSTAALQTLFSTSFFLVPISISAEQGEAWMQLADHFRAQVAEANQASEAASKAAAVSPWALHRFLFVDILLKVLPTVCSKTQYASHAQDFFQLLVLLARDLLTHELSAGSAQVMPHFDWTQLAQRVVHWIKSRPILESKHAITRTATTVHARASVGAGPKPVECDHVLVGLMNLLSSLVQHMPALRDLVAQRPQFSSEAEQLLLNESATAGTSGAASARDHNHAAGLVSEVFNSLFDLPSMRTSHLATQAPKCKRRITRLAAFHLLLTLVTNHPANYLALTTLLLDQNWTQNSVALSGEWEYAPEDYLKSPTGYVGMQNLSATCYLNSMMQQMFMIPEFRFKLLSIQTHMPQGHTAQVRAGSPSSKMMATTAAPAPSSLPAGVAPSDGTDNLLYQMQLLFGSLQEGEKRAYNPVNFCKSIKDWSGQPIDVRIQQDAIEYFNMLCDRLEESLKANQKTLAEQHAGLAPADVGVEIVRETFGGTLEHQLLCLDCPHTSFRSEPFYALPLNVKNKPSVAASLEQFITGETLEGDNAYLCQTCKKKVRTLKRVVVKSLPEILVLNLKRFEFNFDTMTKTKLNDLVAFPHVDALDMEPFTAEGIAKREAEKAASKTANTAADKKEPKAKTDGELASVASVSAPATSGDAPAAAPVAPVSIPSSASPAPTTTYSLVGVLLHSGGSESGHYTSLVKERLPSGAETGRWLEFNDSVVREFDPSLIPAECFGGSYQVTNWDVRARKKVTKEVDKVRSAYLLIYARDDTRGHRAIGSGGGGVVGATPMHSPLKRASSQTEARRAGNDTPNGGASPQRMAAGSSSRATPSLELGPSAANGARSPSHHSLSSSSPPPLMPLARRSHSGPGLAGTRTTSVSKRLESEMGGDDLDSDAAPTMTPAFSRFASFESKLLGSSNPSSPSHRGHAGPGSVDAASLSLPSGPAPELVLPPMIAEKIWQENLTFLRNKQLFQPDYFKFMLSFLALAPTPPSDNDSEREAEAAGDASTPPPRHSGKLYGQPADLDCEEDIRHVQLACTYLTDVLAHAKFITNPAAYARDAANRQQGLEDEEAKLTANASPATKLHAIGGRLGAEIRARMKIDAPGPVSAAAATAAASGSVSVASPTPLPLHQSMSEYRFLVSRFFEWSTPACCWFLHDTISTRNRLRSFLFDCPAESVRDHLSQLCVHVMAQLVPYERALYEQSESVDVSGPVSPAQASTAAAPQPMLQSKSLVLRFIDHMLLNLWRDLGWHWKCLGSYFSLLHCFAGFGHNERMYLLHTHNLVGHLIDFSLGNASPWAARDKYKRPLLGDEDTPPNLFSMFALLSMLIRTSLMPDQCAAADPPLRLPPGLISILDGSIPLPTQEPTPAGLEEGEVDREYASASPAASASGDNTDADAGVSSTPPRRSSHSQSSASPVVSESSWVVTHVPSGPLSSSLVVDHSFILPKTEMELVWNETFLKKLMREQFNSDATREILAHLVWNMPKVDSHVARIFLRLVDESNFDRLEPLLMLLPPLLALQDSLCQQRIDLYLNSRVGLIAKADFHCERYPLFTYTLLRFLILVLGSIEGHPARDYLLASQRDSLYWAISWIAEHHDRQLARSGKPAMINGQPSPEFLRQHALHQHIATAVHEWFGDEYIRARDALEKAELERKQAEHEAMRAAHQERVKQMHAKAQADGDDAADPLLACSDPHAVQHANNLRAAAAHIARQQHRELDDDPYTEERREEQQFGDETDDDDGSDLDDEFGDLSYGQDQRGMLVSGTRLHNLGAVLPAQDSGAFQTAGGIGSESDIDAFRRRLPAGASDDDEEDLSSYIDDPIEAVRKFEEQELARKEGRA